MDMINNFLKRFMDLIISILGIIVLFPLLIVVAILIKITMPGPILFKQERVGKDEKLFLLLKFRSMKVNRQLENNHDFSKDAERLTKFGRIIRRLKIDEVPQLFNVLKGEMSLVGPRPTVKRQVDKYTDEQHRRHEVKPGMTGLAQVKGGTKMPWPERIILDIEYVENNNIFIDVYLIILTFYVTLFGRNNVKRG